MLIYSACRLFESPLPPFHKVMSSFRSPAVHVALSRLLPESETRSLIPQHIEMFHTVTEAQEI